MTAIELTDLKSLFGGYFHQDWYLEAPEPDDMISLFLKSNPSANDVNRIVAQIRRYLEDKDESTIEKGLLEELGCYYLPSADGIAAGDWLRHVAHRLSER